MSHLPESAGARLRHHQAGRMSNAQAIADMLEENQRQRFIARRGWRRRVVGHKTVGVHARRAHCPVTPSRNDPMPTLFVVGLAVLCLFAIFGFISIGQMLQRIAGG